MAKRIRAAVLFAVTGASCGPEVESGTGGGTTSTQAPGSATSAASGDAGAGSSGGSVEPGCAATATIVVGEACYRHVVLDEQRPWMPSDAAAIRLGGSEYPELLVPMRWDGLAVVRFDGERLQLAAEFERIQGDLPAFALDIDGDGRDEALLGLYYWPEVEVISYDQQTSTYRLEVRDDLFPEPSFYPHMAINVDDDPALEIIATVARAQYEWEFIVLDRKQDGWHIVGTPLYAPEIYSEVLYDKPIGLVGRSTTRFAYVSHYSPDVANGWTGVTVVRVTPSLQLEIEAELLPGFYVSDFTSGDFDGDGDTDLLIAGREKDRQDKWHARAAIYEFADGQWLEAGTADLGESLVAIAGDVTNDGVAELISIEKPAQAVDFRTGTRTPLFEMAFPPGLVDLNGDLPMEILYRGPDDASTSDPAPLNLMVSFE